MSKQTENSMIINESDGYKLRATYKRVGAFEFFVIDWEHPNIGYFTDALFFWRSLHASSWKTVKVVRWAEKYKSIKQFFHDYPCFKYFLRHEVAQWLFLKLVHTIRRPTLPNAEPKDVFPIIQRFCYN